MRERDAGKEVHLFLLFEWRTSASVNGRSSKLKAALSLSHLSLWSHVWETDHRREREESQGRSRILLLQLLLQRQVKRVVTAAFEEASRLLSPPPSLD